MTGEGLAPASVLRVWTVMHAALVDAVTVYNLPPPLSIHGLRHACATAALNAGVPANVVSANLRHASLRITLDFSAHVLADQRDMAAEIIDDFVCAAEL